MRVLYFTRDYTPHDHRFLTALAETEHQVFSLRLERRGMQLEDRPLPQKVEQVRWRGGVNPFRWQDCLMLQADLRRVIRSVKPDLIHAGAIQNAAFLAALTGFAPLISMSWGSDLLRDADKNAWMRAVTRYTLKKSSVLVGDCQAVSRKAQEFGMSEEQIVLFPWGVDLRLFSPDEEKGFRIRQGWQDGFVLLSTRSWETLYGVDVLVTAFARAAQQIPELRLILLGGGSQAAGLRGILKHYNVEDRVYFGGQVKNADLPYFYHSADLYLSASHSDGSSVSLMEALACGKPVLVSDIPGNTEWIQNGEAGWLFPDGDVDCLEKDIVDIFQHRIELHETGKRARILAEGRADWSKNFAKLLQAYELGREFVERRSR